MAVAVGRSLPAGRMKHILCCDGWRASGAAAVLFQRATLAATVFCRRLRLHQMSQLVSPACVSSENHIPDGPGSRSSAEERGEPKPTSGHCFDKYHETVPLPADALLVNATERTHLRYPYPGLYK